jgi:hypothetical protein
MASNDKVNKPMMNWKECGRKRTRPKCNILCRHLPGGTEENHEILSHDSLSPDRDVKPGPPEHEAGALITRPPRSVSELNI